MLTNTSDLVALKHAAVAYGVHCVQGEVGDEGEAAGEGTREGKKKKAGKPEKRLRNQFNFSERASQTLNNPDRVNPSHLREWF